MNILKRARVLALVVGMVPFLLGAACGGGGEPQAEPTDSVPSATTTAASPTTTRESLPEVYEPPPNQRQLIGTWREIDGPTFFRFNRDGTFVVDTDKLDVPYYATGTYELAGETIAFTSNGPACADSWEWQVGILKGGRRSEDELHIVFLDAGCNELPGAEYRFARS